MTETDDNRAAARNALDLVKELREAAAERDTATRLAARFLARAQTAEAQVQRVRDVLADPQHTVRRWIDDTRLVDVPAVLAALGEE